MPYSVARGERRSSVQSAIEGTKTGSRDLMTVATGELPSTSNVVDSETSANESDLPMPFISARRVGLTYVPSARAVVPSCFQ